MIHPLLVKHLPRVVVFFATETGNEPVREWLKSLPQEEKRKIGEDIKAAQWMLHWRKPLVDSLGNGLWEVRTRLSNSIARVLFCECTGEIILLHGFKKKTQQTPNEVIKLAKERKKQYEYEQKK